MNEGCRVILLVATISCATEHGGDMFSAAQAPRQVVRWWSRSLEQLSSSTLWKQLEYTNLLYYVTGTGVESEREENLYCTANYTRLSGR